MKRIIPLLCLLALLSSCQFTGNQGGTDTDITLEGVFGKLKDLADKAVEKGWIDTTRTETAPNAAAREEDGAPVRVEPVSWYEKDFSLVYVQHTYVGTAAAVPQSDQTVLITRVGDKAYIQTKLQGAVKKCEVLEATPDGHYKNTIYQGGKVTWEHAYDNDSLTGALAYQLRKKYPVRADLPKDYDFSQAQEGTCCGRPCWIVDIESDTELGRGHLVSTLWIDKEYGFVYSIRIKGTNDLGQKVDVKSFEVTSFTDKPTAKDIPNLTQMSGGTAAIKKQLQDQLNAIKK